MKKIQKMFGFAVIAAIMFSMTVCGGDSGDDSKPPVSAQSPTISLQPQSQVYFPGVTAEPLTVTASVSDGGSLSYQWYSSTTGFYGATDAIEGANTASYTPSTAAAGTVNYKVKVTNTNQGKTSSIDSDSVKIVTGFKEAKNFLTPVSSVAFGGNRFVVGVFNSKTAWSSDGINWTEVDASDVFGSSLSGTVKYVKDRFIAVVGSKIGSSTNGESWTAISNPFGTKYPGAIAYGNSHFYSFGDGIYSTDDMQTWTAVTLSGNTTAITFTWSTVNLGPVAYDNEKFIVIGRDGAAIDAKPGSKLASFNGLSWAEAARKIDFDDSSSIEPDDIIYANNNFLVVGDGNKKIVKSTNGTTGYTEITPPSSIIGATPYILGISYGSDKLFALMSAKWAWSDDDGANWTECIERSYRQIAYGNGVFVAVGDNSVYYTNCP